VDPIVWRRVLVPAQSRLGQLHQVLQAAMGWTDSHLHYFKFGELTYAAHWMVRFGFVTPLKPRMNQG
jgi:hypothetical protein